MKRETFEEVVQQALNRLAVDVARRSAKTRSGARAGIGGTRYGQAEKVVGQAVKRLAGPGRSSKPLRAPSPDLLPPCF